MLACGSLGGCDYSMAPVYAGFGIVRGAPSSVRSVTLAAMWRVLGVLLVLCAGLFPAGAQDARPLNKKLVAAQWPAQWIGPKLPAESNLAMVDTGVFYFRKDLTLAKVPTHYWVHVSADNRFVLHVNGQYAAEGPARGDLF